jgi:hypothetical protein
MGRRCSVCANKNLHRIDFLILNNVGYRQIAEKYCPKGTKIDAFARAIQRHHENNHIPLPDQQAHDDAEKERGKDLQERADEIYELALEAARAAKDNKEYKAVGSCLSPAVKVLEVLSAPKGSSRPYAHSERSIDERLEDLARRRAERKAAADR